MISIQLGRSFLSFQLSPEASSSIPRSLFSEFTDILELDGRRLCGPVPPAEIKTWPEYLPVLVDAPASAIKNFPPSHSDVVQPIDPPHLFCILNQRLAQGAIGTAFAATMNDQHVVVKVSEITRYHWSCTDTLVWTQAEVSKAIKREIDAYYSLVPVWGTHVPCLLGVWGAGSEQGPQTWVLIMDFLSEVLNIGRATMAQK